jgi:hypothetical protein
VTPEGKVKAQVREVLKVWSAYSFMPVQMGYGAATLDFLTCIRGRFVAIETKRLGGLAHVTRRQLDCMDAVRAAGGLAYAVDSGEMLDKLLRQDLGNSNNPNPS